MNKKLYFILFPLLAMLFSIYGKGGEFIPFKKEAAGLSVSGSSIQQKAPDFSDIQKNDRKIKKNKIRIKARDAAAEMDIPLYWEAEAKVVFYQNVTYSGYILYAKSAELPVHNLRGPPAI